MSLACHLVPGSGTDGCPCKLLSRTVARPDPGGPMVVGLGVIELMIHNSGSLKSKRQVVKSILGRVRSKFDLSIAEVDNQDKWQRCTIGFAVVTNEGGHAHRMLETITDYVESLHLAEIIDSRIEIVHC